MSFPIPPNEQERLEELRRFALLDTPPEKAFDHITELAASIFDAPISAVTLIDEDRQWFKSCVGLTTREVGRNFAFCAYAILETEVMVVPDARADVRFADNPMVTGPPYLRFYAGAPLRTSNGLNLGTLTVCDTKPRRRLTKHRSATLAALATLVVAEIELRYEIGERRRVAESLRLLQAAIQQSSESVIITTSGVDLPNPEIVFANPALTKITGYSPEEVIGKTPRIFQGPKTERTVLDDVRARLGQGEEFRFEAVNYRKDGSDFLLSTHISPIRDATGEVTHFICFQSDATERNRVTSALQQAKQEAERANHAKSEFLSRMSHELRTPLHAILGFAQLLEMDIQNGEDKESVGQILQAGNHLLGLINEVLDLARVESGSFSFTPQPVNVRTTLEETLSLVKPLSTAHEVRLEAPSGHLDCDVLSTARRLKQIMLNLVSNAVKFNQKGGSVSISCRQLGERLRINVGDTGRGIASENLAKLFVPFERLDVGDAVIDGVGLGLSLSKQLIEAMGGEIGVESVPGVGSTFWVELPLASGVAGTRTLSVPVATVAAPEPGAPFTLLYIEDNLSNLRLVERILFHRRGMKMISSTKGSVGLEMARQHRPDLVLLDLQLPDMQGDEVLRQLRADPRTARLPVVMISADATAVQIARLRGAGADDYLTKPIDVQKLLALIDAVPPRRPDLHLHKMEKKPARSRISRIPVH